MPLLGLVYWIELVALGVIGASVLRTRDRNLAETIGGIGAITGAVLVLVAYGAWLTADQGGVLLGAATVTGLLGATLIAGTASRLASGSWRRVSVALSVLWAAASVGIIAVSVAGVILAVAACALFPVWFAKVRHVVIPR